MAIPRHISVFLAATTAAYLLSIEVHAGQPDWAKRDTLKLVNKNTLELVCQSPGPSLADARNRAFLSCDSTAIQYVLKDFTFKSVTVETESDASIHNQANTFGSVQNLKCLPLNEAIEQQEAQFSVWLKCRYRLDQAKVTNNGHNEESSLAADALEQKPYRISISSVPQCSSVLVRGKITRKFRCDSTPTVVTATPQDRSLTVRANGKKPKTVPLPIDDSSPPGDTKFLDVFLEE